MDPALAILILIILISVIIHEVAHGYAADALGDPTARLAGRLTLNPVPHIDMFGSILIPALLVITDTPILFGYAKPVPYNPYNLRNKRWGEAIVAGAGVATNIFLAVLFALIARALEVPMPNAAEVAELIARVNLYLGFFNLIPIPPLDGYTTLRGLLPFRFAYELRKFEERMQALGPVGLILVLLAFWFVLAEPFFFFTSVALELLLGR